MKSIIKYFSILSLGLLASASCERFDPDDRIVTGYDLPRCLKPTRLSTEVENNTVTLSIKVFHDAEYYILETYTSLIYADLEPDVSTRVDSLTIKPNQFPFTFTTIEDATLYYRIAAINEKDHRERSSWAVDKFKTKVNPNTTCLTPEPTVSAFFELVKYDWLTTEHHDEIFILESYTSSIPSSGEPDPANLFSVDTLVNEDIPFTKKYPVKDGSYYWRVKAVDTLGVRKTSKWAKGSFAVNEGFAWPEDTSSIDNGILAGVTKTVSVAEDSISKYCGIAKEGSLKAPIYYDGITWMGYNNSVSGGTSNAGQYRGDRFLYNAVKNTETVGVEKITVAKDIGIRFKVTRPGRFKMFRKMSFSGKDFVANPQKYTAVLAVKRNGQISASVIAEIIPDAAYVTSSGSTGRDDDNYYIIFDVTEDMIYGLEEPATVYLWHAKVSPGANLQMDYYPPSWTPSK